MTLRFVISWVVVGGLALIAAGVTFGVYLFGETPLPSAPGNYLVIDRDACALHVLRTPPAQSLVLPASSCTPALPGGNLAGGGTAVTQTCGPLEFARSTNPAAVGVLFCGHCSQGTFFRPDCPLAPFRTLDHLLRWTPVVR